MWSFPAALHRLNVDNGWIHRLKYRNSGKLFLQRSRLSEILHQVRLGDFTSKYCESLRYKCHKIPFKPVPNIRVQFISECKMKTNCNYLFFSHRFLSLRELLYKMADDEVTAKQIVRKFRGNEVYNFQYSVYELLSHFTSLFIRPFHIHVDRKHQISSIWRFI